MVPSIAAIVSALATSGSCTTATAAAAKALLPSAARRELTPCALAGSCSDHAGCESKSSATEDRDIGEKLTSSAFFFSIFGSACFTTLGVSFVVFVGAGPLLLGAVE